jgi:hypothetical protein
MVFQKTVGSFFADYRKKTRMHGRAGRGASDQLAVSLVFKGEAV